MPLTEKKLQALLKSPVPGKQSDGHGLNIQVTKTGAMYWHWRLRTPTENTVSYGVYPEVSLAEARRKHAEARSLRREGKQPNEIKRQDKENARVAALRSAPFETVAREWFELKRVGWSPNHAKKVIRRLEIDVFPAIGALPIAEIRSVRVGEMVRRIETRNVPETANRALKTCGQIFRYAIQSGRIDNNPTENIEVAIEHTVQNMPALTSPHDFAGLLRCIDGYAGTYVVIAALKLSAMLMLRSSELRFADWSEINLEKSEWRIPSSRMKGTKAVKKNGSPHIVPLAKQAVAIFRDLHSLTGPSGFVFKNIRKSERVISENTVNAALRNMGYDTKAQMTGHGFRAIARTLLQEVLNYDPAVIEAQLAHAVPDALGRAYNRTTFVEKRRHMMQHWADYIDSLRAKTPVPSQTQLIPT